MHVYFNDAEPSESEFFEEYNKYNIINFWFVLIFIIKSFGPFCLALQVVPLEFPQGVDILLYHLSVKNSTISNGSLNFYKSFYTSKCLKEENLEHNFPPETVNKMFKRNCKREDFVTEMEVYKYIGFIIGAIVGGILADIFGRRITSLCLSIFWILMAFVLAFLSNIEIFQMCYIAVCSFCSAVNIITFVNFAEITNKKNRFISVYTLCSYVLGVYLINYITKIIPIWTNLVALNASTILIVIFGCWYIPESPRWLLTKHKKGEAIKQLNEISGLNYEYRRLPISSDIEPKNIIVFFNMVLFLLKRKLKHFLLFGMLMIISVLFFSCARWKILISFISTQEFGMLACSVGAASFLFFIPVYILMGKRFGLFFMYILLSIVALAALLINGEGDEVYYNIFGILFGLSTILFLWLYILDVFPTFIRTTVIGYGFAIFGLVGIAATLLVEEVKEFSEFNYYLTFFILGVFGTSVLILPNTTNQELSNFKLFS